jgi:hypothetical protein
MSEKIFLTYTNATAVPYQGSVLGHHIVLNYIDDDDLVMDHADTAPCEYPRPCQAQAEQGPSQDA